VRNTEIVKKNMWAKCRPFQELRLAIRFQRFNDIVMKKNLLGTYDCCNIISHYDSNKLTNQMQQSLQIVT